MNNYIKSVLADIVAQISSPWDWCAAGCGAALAACLTPGTPENNPIITVTGGALMGIVVGNPLITSIERLLLSRKAKNFRNQVISLPLSPKTVTLLYLLYFETKLWKNDMSSNGEFKIQLDKLIHRFRAAYP